MGRDQKTTERSVGRQRKRSVERLVGTLQQQGVNREEKWGVVCTRGESGVTEGVEVNSRDTVSRRQKSRLKLETRVDICS